MPIEIMELVIKAKVETDQNSRVGNAPAPPNAEQQQQKDQQQIENIAQEVLEILKRQNER